MKMEKSRFLTGDARAATGSMTATVTFDAPGGRDRHFAAQAFEFGDDKRIWLLGLEDTSDSSETFLYLELPVDFTGDSVLVTPQGQPGATIYVAVENYGYANSGQVTEIELDRQNKTFSGCFSCRVKDENGIEFDVRNGTFNINYVGEKS